jgi:cardiolipin synthase (CMP-forming)
MIHRDEWLTLPNAITVARLVVFVPLTMWLILTPGRELAATLALVLFSSTDWIDGFIARRTDTTTRLGEIMDPIADRAGIILIAIALVLAGIVPLWFVLVIGISDVVMGVFGLIFRHNVKNARVSFWGKLRTALVMVAMPLALLAAAPQVPDVPLAAIATVLLAAGAVLHIGVAVHYILVLAGAVEPPHRFVPEGPPRTEAEIEERRRRRVAARGEQS